MSSFLYIIIGMQRECAPASAARGADKTTTGDFRVARTDVILNVDQTVDS
jgi:hypothetical protein